MAEVRSFIDLRAFAASVEAPATGDYRSARVSLPLAEGPCSVELLALDGAAGSDAGLPGDEFVIVLAGSLRLGEVMLETDACAVIPSGVAFDWQAAPGTRALAMRYAIEKPAADRIVLIDESAALTPSNPPLAELLVGPTPSCRNHTDYLSSDGVVICGTWDSTPYHRTAMRYRHHELMHLLNGSVTFRDETGASRTFGKGDIFLLEHGAMCSWDSQENVKKVYAIWRPVVA
ncbi:cupin domain-containing protein [Sphingomonas sp. GM_Shp_1]|uniref:cupin domain-containing protein n=1 Tax=Sphingomonas sp. GM_Shp_1 TaxID=2937381 RepID=UPI00226B657A|nr:cupin domain-containing protein [Sphingomonas sp. GM_Shp_1]